LTAGRRRIAFVSGTRAEYGLLTPLMLLLREDPAIDFRLVVCAAHLSPELGLTKNQIIEDGFAIDDEVDMLLSSDTKSSIAKSVGLGCIGFSDAFRRMSPDLVVLLGDRFEMLAAAQTALLMGIPTAHLHGGELTEGAVDDSIRHAITKFSSWHFVAAEAYRRRVIQLGEDPQRVFNVGAIGLDVIRSLQPQSRAKLKSGFGIPADREFLLVSWHPETLSEHATSETTRTLIETLSQCGHAIVMSYPNADWSHREIVDQIEQFASRDPRVTLVRNFGQQAYLSAMSHSAAVIGNSSSGILEAPSLGVPTVNIGTRQQGRLRAPSVIDCNANGPEIRQAIAKALSAEFKAIAVEKLNPHGNGTAVQQIAVRLKSLPIGGPVRKHFHDLNTDPGPMA
jgi:UDP-hydrolysing UDP-N-acetyl-D-glucosamine 2-epimerase